MIYLRFPYSKWLRKYSVGIKNLRLELTGRIMVVWQVDLSVSTQKLPQLVFRAENLLNIGGVGIGGLEILFVVDPI